ncbi:VUT family protein [bacterium SCSIO 12844]|nr:VUT family protein [bacterium SCSIO 12844]
MKIDLTSASNINDQNTSPKNTQYNTYHFLVSLYCILFFLSNITASKVIILFNLSFYTAIVPAAIFIYSVSFFIDDIITDIYGFNAARNAIKTALKLNFIALILLFLIALIHGINQHDPIYEITFGQYGITIRVFILSFISFAISELTNSYILSKLKIRDYRNHKPQSLSYNPLKNLRLIRRFLLSTSIGALLDSFIFCFGAFSFTGLSFQQIFMMAVTQYVIKMLYELLACPFITSTLCTYIKRKEKIDTLDKQLTFNISGFSANHTNRLNQITH